MPIDIMLFVFMIVMWFWIMLRIRPSSRLMALLIWFIPPAAIIPLFQYWGNPESDIRVPFFLVLAAIALGAYLKVWHFA